MHRCRSQCPTPTSTWRSWQQTQTAYPKDSLRRERRAKGQSSPRRSVETPNRGMTCKNRRKESAVPHEHAQTRVANARPNFLRTEEARARAELGERPKS
eukprot:13921288-Alexandrium_andersonii.AAC.1